jgi:hypothetical protein
MINHRPNFFRKYIDILEAATRPLDPDDPANWDNLERELDPDDDTVDIMMNPAHEHNAQAAARRRLIDGQGSTHAGHEGEMMHHDIAADEHEGTRAGEHHKEAAQSHYKAAVALRQGKMEDALKHSSDAEWSAFKAKTLGGEDSNSENVHRDHVRLYKDHF